ncbi:GNAT family N-acetyltransferase [Actinocorallia sp. A-T 12471]|uniref:GNAT family N-acetyltransferase n=1 Tax=Actinocorallia sp. A-T 12471 TaxID=3089813 RepID=UPI0029CFC71B|nr:GNAT family N-acetyltransferase [Actinocorallia sp. A-T 12471]MDX6743724.1 GNAT family N-acetyltransferase [Actinocorallia sp. A-T 12471]
MSDVSDLSGLVIRKARPADEAALADLDRRTWAPDNSAVPRPAAGPHFFDRFHLPDHFLVAELTGPEGNRVVGFLRLVQPVLQQSAAHVRQIQGLGVDHAVRGRGVGAALLAEACAEARRQGARKITLRVLSSNTAARRLYERAGFHVEGVLREEFRVEGVYVDDILMARRL